MSGLYSVAAKAENLSIIINQGVPDYGEADIEYLFAVTNRTREQMAELSQLLADLAMDTIFELQEDRDEV